MNTQAIGWVIHPESPNRNVIWIHDDWKEC